MSLSGTESALVGYWEVVKCVGVLFCLCPTRVSVYIITLRAWKAVDQEARFIKYRGAERLG